MYQRSVAHARGWRQLPNYSLWAGIGSFFQVSLKYIPFFKRPRVVRMSDVRNGMLPTAQYAKHKPRGSRSSSGYYPP